MSLKAASTMNRFGLGARLKSGAQQAVPANPQVIGALPGRPQLAQEFREYQMQSRELRQVRDAGRGQDTIAGQKKNTQHSGIRRNLRDNYTAAVAAPFDAALRQRNRFCGKAGPFLVQKFRGFGRQAVGRSLCREL